MSSSSGNALAVTLWPSSTNRGVRDTALVLVGAAILAVSAKVSVPFWPVPMTLQTFAVMLVAATYGMRLGTATVLTYLVAGLVGFPVFTNTPPAVAGPMYFLGTTGGFLLGFLPGAAIVGWAADRGWGRSVLKLAASMIVADVVVFAIGFAWLAWFAFLSSGAHGIGMAGSFANGVQPFIVGDLVKIALAAFGVPAIWSLVERRKP